MLLRSQFQSRHLSNMTRNIMLFLFTFLCILALLFTTSFSNAYPWGERSSIELTEQRILTEEEKEGRAMRQLNMELGMVSGHLEAYNNATDFNNILVDPVQKWSWRTYYPDIDPNLRTEFGIGTIRTTAFPSAGGIVFEHFTPTELEWLSLSRSIEANRSNSSEAEDRFAAKIIQLGAQWWPNWAFYERHRMRIERKVNVYGFHMPPKLHVGYPRNGSGLWVLPISRDKNRVPYGANEKEVFPREPAKLPERLAMTLNMDERCEVLKEFGGTFYEKPEDCEHLAGCLEQAIKTGKHYETLMRKMDSKDYRGEFYRSGSTGSWSMWDWYSFEGPEDDFICGTDLFDHEP